MHRAYGFCHHYRSAQCLLKESVIVNSSCLTFLVLQNCSNCYGSLLYNTTFIVVVPPDNLIFLFTYLEFHYHIYPSSLTHSMNTLISWFYNWVSTPNPQHPCLFLGFAKYILVVRGDDCFLRFSDVPSYFLIFSAFKR